jgi:hypothetical protein
MVGGRKGRSMGGTNFFICGINKENKKNKENCTSVKHHHWLLYL